LQHQLVSDKKSNLGDVLPSLIDTNNLQQYSFIFSEERSCFQNIFDLNFSFMVES